MNKESIEEVSVALISLLNDDIKQLKLDLQRAISFLSSFGYSTDESRRFCDEAKQRWLGEKDG